MDSLNEAIGSGLAGVVQELQRPILVCELFCGISGFREFARVSKLAFANANTCDKEGELRHFYRSLSMLEGGVDLQNMKLGDTGDVTAVCNDLVDADMLVAGPPCEPWAASGKRLGENDCRSQYYWVTVDIIVTLARRGCLKVVVVENSPCIMEESSSSTIMLSFADKVLRRLKEDVPFFCFEYTVSDLKQTGLPHGRSRAWLRGIHRKYLADEVSLPPPILYNVSVALSDILIATLPNIAESQISTEAKRRGMVFYKSRVLQDRSEGRSGTIAVVDLDRRPHMKFAISLTYDFVPTLRKKGPDFFVMSVADLHEPESQRKVFRYLADQERFLLQGHRSVLHQLMPNKTMSRRCTGNAYPVPMLASVLSPLLVTLKVSSCSSAVDPADAQPLFKRQRLDA
jgi:site-specific DNA-cytosine methylase